jgi:hypothetical protein
MSGTEMWSGWYLVCDAGDAGVALVLGARIGSLGVNGIDDKAAQTFHRLMVIASANLSSNRKNFTDFLLSCTPSTCLPSITYAISSHIDRSNETRRIRRTMDLREREPATRQGGPQVQDQG